MTQRSAGLPSPEQVIELLQDEFARAGYEVDDVAVDTRAHPPRIRVVVDGDAPLDLDSVSTLSRSASALLDAVDTGPTAYVLEVSSPGVDRPLTDEKHFRRARARLVEVSMNDGSTLTGRLGATANGVAELVVRSGRGLQVQQVPLSEVRKAVVQVEFSPPNAKELELVTEAGT
ncbi:MAG: ribosome maturation factor RimP [Mycobacterium sp.]